MIDLDTRICRELDRWQPLTDVAVRWDDVLSRASGDRMRPAARRRLLVVAVAVLLIIGGGSAYAIARAFGNGRGAA